MSISLRLDGDLERELNRQARVIGIPKSDVTAAQPRDLSNGGKVPAIESMAGRS
jgi:hypothetical protein